VRELRRRDPYRARKILREEFAEIMRELEPDENGNVHVYECSAWDSLAPIREENVVHSHCVYCHACLTSFRITATRCEAKGHYILCPECMALLRKEHAEHFKQAGYIRANKLERYQ
jgi:hypothetical protein